MQPLPPLPISTSTPPFQGYAAVLAKILELPKWPSFWKVLLPPLIRGTTMVFNNHSCIRLIRDKYHQSFDFKFWVCIHKSSVKIYQWNKIECNKSSGGHIPSNIIEMAKEELTVPIRNCINKCISWNTFWMNFKLMALSQSTKTRCDR